MRIASRFILVGAALATLTAGWIYLFAHSRAVDAERQNATLAMLKELKQMDSDWNSDLMKSQAEIIRSYDALIRPLRGFSDIFAALAAEAGRLRDDELKKAVGEIREAIERKTGLIDRFKAQNALLKNSLRYAPTAYKDIQEQMRSQRDELRARIRGSTQSDAAARSAFTLADLDSNVSTLVGDALRYHSVPDAELAAQLKAGIGRMREAAPSYPAAVREPVENLMAHLEAILQLRTRQTALLQEIAAIPVVEKIDSLGNALLVRFDGELQQQFDYQRLLLAYSAFALLLVFGSAGAITYRNATERRRLHVLVGKQTLELRENEAQLVHAQKMNALGEMVASITHEVNTPLAAVKSGLQSSIDLLGILREYFDESGRLAKLLSIPAPADEEGRSQRRITLGRQLLQVNTLREELVSFEAMDTVTQLLGEGVKNVEHIYHVVLNMLNFSRLDRSGVAPVKIEEGIENTLVIAKHFLKDVQITRQFGDTPQVSCDIAQMNQVFLNLIKNAAQALPESGGEIRIETRAASAGEVCIAVVDNGAGIPPDVLMRIWEPFFTTREAGSGTGLGLSTCRKIVAAHGGRIQVDSNVGMGTTFTITLPVAPPASLYEEHGQEVDSRFLTPA